MKRLVVALVLSLTVGGLALAQPTSGPQGPTHEERNNTQEPQAYKSEAKPPDGAVAPTKGGNNPPQPWAEQQERQDSSEGNYVGWFMRGLLSFIEFADRNDKAIVAVGTIFIAAFTVILGLATIFLWRATVALVKSADRNAEKQLRAYVVIDSIGLQFLGPQPLARATIITKNAGQTPAINFRTSIYLHWATNPLEEIVTVRRSHESGSSPLMPSQTNITVCDVGFGDRRDLPEFIKHEAFAIHLLGTIVYEDVFGTKYVEPVDMIATGERAFSRHPFVYFMDESLKQDEIA